MSQRNSGIAALLMRAHQERAECGKPPAAKFPYYPRKRIWRGESLAVCEAQLPPGLVRKSTCRIHNRKDAALPTGSSAAVSWTSFHLPKLTPQVKIHDCAAPFPESCTRQQLSPVIASFQSRRLGLLARRIAVFKLRSRPLFALSCLLFLWQDLDDGLLCARTSRSPQSNRPSA